MTILCGTDFSENAVQAASAAAAIAQLVAEPLKLVHVVNEPSRALAAAAAGSHDPVRTLLEAHAERLRDQFRIDVDAVLLEGLADEQLLTLAGEIRPSLIVVAALGQRKEGHWLLGSVAERVVQRASAPVLVVRDAARIEAWARGTSNLKVMLGTDLGATSKGALDWVQGLRRIRPCDVQVVQVAWPIGEHARFGVNGPVELDGLRPELQALLVRDLEAWAGPVAGEGQAAYLVRPGWGRIDAQLASLADDAQVDLLVVGAHQRAWPARVWQGSVSRGAIHFASCNVACIPRSAGTFEAAGITGFRSVLIPTDFSPLANDAIRAGYGLLSAGGTVHLIHVLAPADTADTPAIAERLRALVPVGAGLHRISTQVHVVKDETASRGIEHAAARLGVDLICMATHGRSGPSQLLLGSQAEHVLHSVRQPVLLVKAEVE